LRIDGPGLRTSYSYDAANRPTGQQYQDGTRVTNTYDANSQRTVLSDLAGSYTSTYDPDGRVSSVINPAGIAYPDESKARCLSFQPEESRRRNACLSLWSSLESSSDMLEDTSG
jgi:YD repeat-containing protein